MTDRHGAVSTRSAQADRTRRRLVDAAVTRFADMPYDDVGVADIAKDVGVSHGLLFHYFGSKRGLYLAAIREAANQLDAAFIVDPMLPPGAQIRQALTAHLRHLKSHRGVALRLVLGGRGIDPDAWEVFESSRLRALAGGTAILGLDASNATLRMMGRAWVAAIDEATIFWLHNDELFGLDAMVDAMITMITSALSGAGALDPSLEVQRAISALDGAAAPPTPARVGSPRRTVRRR